MCHIDCRRSPPLLGLIYFFWQSIAWYLDEKIVSSIIDGVYDAVKVKQSQYTINTKIPIYKTEMYCMTSMIDIIVHPRIRRLDMEQLPRILRTQVTAKLQVKIYFTLSLMTLWEIFALSSRDKKDVTYHHRV